MLKAIIIDDEERARDLLATSLRSYCPQVSIVAQCSNVLKGVEQIQLHQPDVVFLDIEMPNYSGFELLDFFGEINFEIIFVTAYSQYAIKAFEVSAVDYLLKPLQIDRLETALKKVEERLALKDSAHRINTLKENLQTTEFQKLAIPLVGGYQFINIKDIVALEAARAYCHFHLEDKRKILVSKSLSTYEEILDTYYGFVRVHRSFLVNINFVERYQKKDQRIELVNNLFVKVSRDRKEHFEQVFLKFKPTV